MEPDSDTARIPDVAGPDGQALTDIGDSLRRALMADVAALAGVSQMTVSRVINRSSGVRAETRATVLAAMKELDYRPNVAARALATGKSMTLGIVSFDTTLYGPASTVYGIERAARAAGYYVSIATMEKLSRPAMVEAVERLTSQSVDGIIVTAPNAEAANALRYLPPDVPLVAVEAGRRRSVPSVSLDQGTGARTATEHLLSLGHETVWHIAGPVDWLEAQARERAWRQTLLREGRQVPPVLTGDWSARSGYEQASRIIEADGATAVFAANDQMALGLLRRLREAGVRVPGDISIVGFDDVPEAAYFSPPLTTVRQDFGEVGRLSLKLLLDQMEGAPRSQSAVVKTKLILRESTGPAPPA